MNLIIALAPPDQEALKFRESSSFKGCNHGVRKIFHGYTRMHTDEVSGHSFCRNLPVDPPAARARGPATRIAGAAQDASEGVPAPPP